MASTTLMNRYKQVCTLRYIGTLYKNKEKMSGYSYEGYLDYLKNNGAEEKFANEDFIANSKLYVDSKSALKKGKIAEGVSGLYKVIFKGAKYLPYTPATTLGAVHSHARKPKLQSARYQKYQQYPYTRRRTNSGYHGYYRASAQHIQPNGMENAIAQLTSCIITQLIIV